ncbi:MAG: ribosome small subunit-dependent GTPase A, partial [Acidobacteriota bacterium]
MAQDVGRVVETHGKFHWVWDGRELLKAFPGGRLALPRARERTRNRVAVGDLVRIRRDAEGSALIEGVEPRRNAVSRRLTFSGAEQVIAANLDLLCVVLAPNPALNTAFLDRTLVEAEGSSIPAAVVVNKLDLLDPRAVEELLAPYRSLGYPVFPMAARTGAGVAPFLEAVAGRWVLLLGHSGVGKTTLVNRAAPGLDRPVGEVDPSRGKGRHTTTGAYAHRLSDGTFLVDTAGIREFGLSGVDFRVLEGAFREIHAAGLACRFPDCRHREEPRCAVRAAVEEGRIPRSRYESYLRLLAEVEGGGG